MTAPFQAVYNMDTF